MAKYIVQHRRGTSQQWASEETIIPMEGEIVIEIDEENSLHKLKIGDGVHTYSELAYLMAGDEVITQVLAKALPRVVSVTLDVDKWTKTTCATNPNLGYYSQSVATDGITKYSRLDLQPDADMMAEFQQLNLAFVTENKNGSITVYSVGDMPLKTYTVQATIVETECDLDKIVGIPVGKPTTIIDDTSDTSETTTWSANHIAAEIADVASGRIVSMQNVDKQAIVIDDVSSVKHKISVDLQSKNLFVLPWHSNDPYTTNGITFDTQEDGSIIVTGTATANAAFHIKYGTKLVPGTYSYRVIGSASGLLTSHVGKYSGTTLVNIAYDDGSGTTFTINDEDAENYTYGFNLYIKSENGHTFTGEQFYPMLVKGNVIPTEYIAGITDDTEIELSVSGRNLIPYPYDGTTLSAGITFTDNGDGSVTLKGTNDGSRPSVFYLVRNSKITLPAGTYCGIARSTGVLLQGGTEDGDYPTLGDTFTLNNSTTLIMLYLIVAKGSTQTFDNLTVYPMLTVGDTAPTKYELYNGSTITTTLGNMPVDIEAIAPTATIMVDLPNLMFKEIKYLKELSISYPEATENMPGFMSVDDKSMLKTIAENYVAKSELPSMTDGNKNHTWVSNTVAHFADNTIPLLGDTWIYMNNGTPTKSVLLIDANTSATISTVEKSVDGDSVISGTIGKYKINVPSISSGFASDWHCGSLALLNASDIFEPLVATGIGSQAIYTNDSKVVDNVYSTLYTTKFYEL